METTKQFAFEGVGKETGKRVEGLFSVRLLVSQRDLLREDMLRRSALGPGDGTGALAEDIAVAYAFCKVRLSETPQWWKESGDGLDLLDTNILVEVNNKALSLVNEAREARQKAAVAAQKEIRQAVAE